MEKTLRIILLVLVVLLPAAGLCSNPSSTTEDDEKLSWWIDPLLAKNAGKSGAYVLEKGEESLLARAWIAERAEKSIRVQYFIWSTDNIGILAAESLLRAADRGVHVQVIVDDLLIDAPSRNMLALVAHPNIDVKIYNAKHSVGISKPERIAYLLTDFRSSNQRMHDKSFIVDGKIAITGGRNMADEYFDYNQKYNFRDRDVLLMGPVAHDMEANFNQFWQSEYTESVENLLKLEKIFFDKSETENIYNELHAYAQDPENFAPEVHEALENLPKKFPMLLDGLVWEDIKFIHDIPGKNNKRISLGGGGETTSSLIDLVTRAKKSITIQSPYLVMPKGGIEFFRNIIENGVDVKINTNSMASTDNLQAFSGYKKQRKKILKSGIEIYEFRPHPEHSKKLIERYEKIRSNIPIFAIHAKTMVIDSRILYIGTFNFDPRSANLNTEIGVLIENEQLALQVEESIKRDMSPQNSWNAAVDDPDSHAPLFKRLKINFWKLLPLRSLL